MPRVKDWIENFFPTGYFYEFKHIFHLAWPTILIQTLQFIQQPIAVMFCGHLGKAELDAVALANSLINVTGISICSGMCTACDTLLSQTYGSKNRHKMGVIVQRALMIVPLAVLPCLAIHLNTESLMLLLGQDPEVSKLTGEYMLIFIPGMVLYFAYFPFVKYMLNQKIVYPTLALCVVPPLVSVLLHYLLVIVFQYGTTGSAIAQSCGYSTFFPITTLYIYFSKVYKETWHGWSWECLLHWGQFYRLALAGLLMVCIEWWSFEIGTFLAGILGTTELGAQSILLQTEVICYMDLLCYLSLCGTVLSFLSLTQEIFGMGIGISANIRIGHYLGGNNPIGAKSAYRTALTMICGLNLIVAGTIVGFREYIARIYTNVPEVVELTITLLPIMGLYIIFDGITAVSTGILRGCGRQYIGAGVVFISYIFMALPVGISLMFLTSLRLSGLWWALATAMVINAGVYQIFLSRIDWADESKRAWRRVGCKISVSQRPYQSDFAKSSLEYTEKSALLDNQFNNDLNEDNRQRSSSAPIPPRKTSFMYPNPDVETKIIEKSLNDDFSDISWNHLLFRRFLVFLLMLSFFIAGLFCRLLVPIPVHLSDEYPQMNNATVEFSISFLNPTQSTFPQNSTTDTSV